MPCYRLENSHSIHIPVRAQKWPPCLILQGHVTAKLLTMATASKLVPYKDIFCVTKNDSMCGDFSDFTNDGPPGFSDLHATLISKFEQVKVSQKIYE